MAEISSRHAFIALPFLLGLFFVSLNKCQSSENLRN
jgi:hypothetical protein